LCESDLQVFECFISTVHTRAERSEHVVDRPVLRPLLKPFGDDLIGLLKFASAL
jgi:hypothetical protein